MNEKMKAKDFKRVYTHRDFVIFAILLAVGISAYFISQGLGITIAICALARLALKSGYKESSNGPTLKRRKIDLTTAIRQEWKDYLGGRDIEIRIEGPQSESGALLLELYYNKEAEVAYAQLYEFANYSYEKVTELTPLKGERALRIIKLLDTKK